MAKGFISDAEMMELEKAGKVDVPAQPPGFISDEDMERLAAPKYEAPIGPPAGAFQGSWDEAKLRLKADSGLFPEAKQQLYPEATNPTRHPIQGTAPLVVPAGAIPSLAKAATALSEGKGLAYLAGRTALSTGQGAAMSLADTKEGESWQDKIDRAKSGAKLSGGIQLAVESIPVVGKMAGYAGRKVGQALSGVDENLIKNYADRTDEVNSMIKQNGGDITAAADQVRTELSSGIQAHKARLNAQITRTLEKAAPDPVIPVQPILDKLNAAKGRLNANLKSEAVAEIDDMLTRVAAEAKDGKLSLKSLYEIKQFLSERGRGAYQKGGQIFNTAKESARAAKDAATDAREMLRPVAGAISEADSQLSKLHAIESRLNKNLLAPGKPDGALMAAGSGANARNAATLRELEKVSGVPVSQKAKDLATARSFANPSLNPTDWTGKATARMLLGSTIGAAMSPEERTAGALAGGLVANPMAVKLAINAGNVGKTALNASKIPAVTRFVRENPVASQTGVQLAARQIRKENPPKQAEPAAVPVLGDGPKQDREPAKKGTDKFAEDGLRKLGLNDSDLGKRALQSKDGKSLLIKASHYRANDPRLKQIRNQIEKGWGTR